MTKTNTDKIPPPAMALQALPDETQDSDLADAECRAADMSCSQMTDGQRAEVKRRLAQPRITMPHENVRAILRRCNPAL